MARDGWLAAVEVPRERRARAPLARGGGGQAPAELGEPVFGPHRARTRCSRRSSARYARSGETSIDRSQIATALARSPCRRLHVAQMEVGRNHAAVEVDRGLEPARGLVEPSVLERLQPKLVLEEREDRLRLRLVGRSGNLRQALARDVGLLPLVLVFLELLEVDERRFVFGIELEDVGERRDRAVDEPAAPVVEAEAEQDVRVLDLVQPRPLQQRLMFLNRAADLTLFAIQVAEDEPQLERAGVEPRGFLELFDRQVDLSGDEIVQAEDEVRRLPDPPPIDPAAFDELVALPRLAGREADEQREKDADEDEVVLHLARQAV